MFPWASFSLLRVYRGFRSIPFVLSKSFIDWLIVFPPYSTFCNDLFRIYPSRIAIALVWLWAESRTNQVDFQQLKAERTPLLIMKLQGTFNFSNRVSTICIRCSLLWIVGSVTKNGEDSKSFSFSCINLRLSVKYWSNF